MGVIIIFSLIIIAVISLIVVISCLKAAGRAERQYEVNRKKIHDKK
ncbi:MAG: hypothetical protein PUE12_14505 [Oscillospiraceae bacterium]|nr:hypothetical protein [Oscillospiraceae bacterium]